MDSAELSASSNHTPDLPLRMPRQWSACLRVVDERDQVRLAVGVGLVAPEDPRRRVDHRLVFRDLVAERVQVAERAAAPRRR